MADAALFKFERVLQPDEVVLDLKDTRFENWGKDLNPETLAFTKESINFALRHRPCYTLNQLPQATRRFINLTALSRYIDTVLMK